MSALPRELPTEKLKKPTDPVPGATSFDPPPVVLRLPQVARPLARGGRPPKPPARCWRLGRCFFVYTAPLPLLGLVLTVGVQFLEEPVDAVAPLRRIEPMPVRSIERSAERTSSRTIGATIGFAPSRGARVDAEAVFGSAGLPLATHDPQAVSPHLMLAAQLRSAPAPATPPDSRLDERAQAARQAALDAFRDGRYSK
ncbi:MAG: hypothetical protein ACRC1K_24595 [Planctomycetia bacterium]